MVEHRVEYTLEMRSIASELSIGTTETLRKWSARQRSTAVAQQGDNRVAETPREAANARQTRGRGVRRPALTSTQVAPLSGALQLCSRDRL